MKTIKDNLEKLEVLSDIYHDLGKHGYSNKQELGVAKLKMKLVKKEMLLLNYLINKELSE